MSGERLTEDMLPELGWCQWNSPWYWHPSERHEFGPLAGVDIVKTRDGLNLRVEFDVLNPSRELVQGLVEALKGEK